MQRFSFLALRNTGLYQTHQKSEWATGCPYGDQWRQSNNREDNRGMLAFQVRKGRWRAWSQAWPTASKRRRGTALVPHSAASFKLLQNWRQQSICSPCFQVSSRNELSQFKPLSARAAKPTNGWSGQGRFGWAPGDGASMGGLVGPNIPLSHVNTADFSCILQGTVHTLSSAATPETFHCHSAAIATCGRFVKAMQCTCTNLCLTVCRWWALAHYGGKINVLNFPKPLSHFWYHIICSERN